MAKKFYTFSELSDEVKNKLAEKARESYELPDDWYEPLIEEFVERINEKYGIEISEDDVRFSGFYSQGDGASFTFDNQYPELMNEKIDAENNIFLAGWEKDEKLLKYIKKLSEEKGGIYECSCERNNSLYVHERSVTCFVNEEMYYVKSDDDFIDEFFDVSKGWERFVIDPGIENQIMYLKMPESGIFDYNTKYTGWVCETKNTWSKFEFYMSDIVRIINEFNLTFDDFKKDGFTVPQSDSIPVQIEEFLDANDWFKITSYVASRISLPKFLMDGLKVDEAQMNYSLADMMATDDSIEYIPDLETKISDLRYVINDNLDEMIISESQQLYSDLKQEYEDLTSTEQIVEFLEYNDDEQYNEDGSIYYGEKPKLRYDELSPEVKNKLNSRYYENYDFTDFHDAEISDWLQKIRDLGITNPRFDYEFPYNDWSSVVVKLRYDSYDFNIAKTWILAGLPQNVIDSTNTENEIPEQYKEFCKANKEALFKGLNRTMTDWVRSQYLEDIDEETISQWYDEELFYPDGTSVDWSEDVDDEE